MNKVFTISLISLALLVGLLYLAPPVLIGLKLHSLNKPFVLLQLSHHADETEGYVQKSRDVYDGHFPPKPTIFPWLPSLLFSGMLVFTQGNIDIAYLAISFVFSIIIFLFFYYLALVFLENRVWALFLALVGVLTPIATHLPQALTGFSNFSDLVLKNFYPLIKTPLDRLFLNRIDDPLLTYPVYLLAIVTLYLFWKRPSFSTAAPSAFFAGLLFYTYFHYWVYWMIVIGLLFFYTLWSTIKTGERERLRYFLLLIGIIILISVPYFINYFHFRAIPHVEDLIKRIGVEYGRNFRFSRIFEYLFYGLLGFLVYWAFGRKAQANQTDRNKVIFFWSALVAMFISWNVQLVTGFMPHPYNFPRAFSPLIFLILASLVYAFGKNLSWRKGSIILSALMALLIIKKVVNALVFVNPPPEFLQMYSFDPGIVGSWQWINKNLPGEPIIISPAFDTTHYLAVYTAAQPFLEHGQMRLVSNADLEEHFLVANKLFGVRPEVLFGEKENLAPLYYNYFHLTSFDVSYRNNFDKTLKVSGVPAEKIGDLKNRFKFTRADWAKIGADYAYYGPAEKKLVKVDLSREKDLKLVYKNSSVEIYQIRK